MKTMIIGHRGAAGTQFENTIAGFKAAIAMGVDAIELDVRKTADDAVVVCHDGDLLRVAGQNILINSITLPELRQIKLKDGVSTVPILDEVLDVAGNTLVLVEVKGSGMSKQLLKVLDRHPKANITIISFKLKELRALKSARPELHIYLNERTKAIEAIQSARAEKFNGVGLNFWLLNPIAYFLARRANLQIFVYTVNSRVIGALIHLLYPKVAICSDHPEYFLPKG